MSNAILERIHQVIGNLVHTCNITQTYVDKYDPRSGILAALSFVIRSTRNWLKGYSLGQLIFVHDMILPIKHKVNWESIRQKKRTRINKDNIRKNINRVDHDYNAEDKVILDNHTV